MVQHVVEELAAGPEAPTMDDWIPGLEEIGAASTRPAVYRNSAPALDRVAQSLVVLNLMEADENRLVGVWVAVGG